MNHLERKRKEVGSPDIGLLLPENIVAAFVYLLSLIDGKEEWPKEGEKIWYITAGGGVTWGFWDGNNNLLQCFRSFLGIYKSEQEAREALEKIKEAIKGIV